MTLRLPMTTSLRRIAAEPGDPPAPFVGPRRAERGRLLVMAGFPAEAAYLIRRGQVRVFLVHADGRETTTGVLGPGHLVGVSALLGEPTHHAFVQALTPTEAWVLSADRLHARLDADPALVAALCTALSHRLALAEGLLGDVLLRPVDERIGAALGRLAPCLGGERPRLTREDLGKLVGARRETISRAAARRVGTGR